jgi:RNA-binding protein
MTSTSQDKKRLRSIAHQLSPVVTIAQKGITESISEEITRALNQHELIKVKIFAADRDSRKELTQQICSDAKAELIQSIGNVAVIYRAAEKPNPKLSNIIRFGNAK